MRRRRFRRRALLLALVVVGVLVAASAALAAQAARDLRAARADLETAKQQTRALEFQPAERALDRAEQLIARARNRLGFFPIRIAAAIPYAGRSVRAVDRIAEAAAEVVVGARAALSVSDELPDQDEFRLDGGRLPSIDWRQVEQRSVTAAAAFARAQQLAGDAPTDLVPGAIVRARDELLAEVRDARGTAESLATGARVLAGMLGMREPRRHLVVVQNLAEMRATGGAIEAVMLLGADAGAFELLRADGDEQILGLPGDPSAGHRLNRDPSFPEAAQRIAARYRQATGVRADGVIALDVHAIAAMLRVTGAVAVDGRRIDGDNAVGFLSRQIFRHYPSETAQSGFLGAVTAATWRKLTGARLSVPDLIEQLGAAAREKHVLIWSREQREQRGLADLGVAGAFPQPPAGGALLAVAGNQATIAELDTYARRSLDYRVTLAADGAARATLEVTVAHEAAREEIPPVVLAKSPGGVLRSDLAAWLGGEPQRARLAVRPGRTASRRFEAAYQTTPGEYRLLVFRQPTLRPDQVSVTITLPDGASVTSLPAGAEIDGSTVRWTGAPTSDLELLVRYA